MAKFTKLVNEMLDAFFEGYDVVQKNGKTHLRVIDENAAAKASKAISRMVLETSRELWDELDQQGDSLTGLADQIDFERMTGDSSNIDTVFGTPQLPDDEESEDELGMQDPMADPMAAGGAPGGPGAPGLGQMFTPESFDLDRIFETEDEDDDGDAKPWEKNFKKKTDEGMNEPSGGGEYMGAPESENQPASGRRRQAYNDGKRHKASQRRDDTLATVDEDMNEPSGGGEYMGDPSSESQPASGRRRQAYNDGKARKSMQDGIGDQEQDLEDGDDNFSDLRIGMDDDGMGGNDTTDLNGGSDGAGGDDMSGGDDFGATDMSGADAGDDEPVSDGSGGFDFDFDMDGGDDFGSDMGDDSGDMGSDDMGDGMDDMGTGGDDVGGGDDLDMGGSGDASTSSIGGNDDDDMNPRKPNFESRRPRRR